MLYTSCRMLGALRPDENPETALPETLFDGLGRAVHTQDRRTRTAQHTTYDALGRVSGRTVSGVALDFTNVALTKQLTTGYSIP
jgi:hypothetical protein